MTDREQTHRSDWLMTLSELSPSEQSGRQATPRIVFLIVTFHITIYGPRWHMSCCFSATSYVIRAGFSKFLIVTSVTCAPLFSSSGPLPLSAEGEYHNFSLAESRFSARELWNRAWKGRTSKEKWSLRQDFFLCWEASLSFSNLACFLAVRSFKQIEQGVVGRLRFKSSSLLHNHY